MKNKLLLLAALAAPIAATAQVQLVAGWDFGQFTFEGFAFTQNDSSFVNASFIPANYSSIGGNNPVKTHNEDNSPVSAGVGSIGWSLADADNNLVFASASVNTANRTMPDFAGTLLSNGASDPNQLGLGFANMGGSSFSLTVNLTGYTDYDPATNGNFANFSFSAAAETAVSIEWFVSGISIGSTNLSPGGTHAAYTVDLPSSFYGQESTLIGVIGNDSFFTIDNVQIAGSAVPEPSTYAAILGACGLVFAVYRNRRKRA
jgi:hypothetical protein